MPERWTPTTLGELAALEYGKALTEVARDGGPFPVFGSAGVVGSHSKHLGPSDAPMIVVGRKGTAGAVHWSEVPAWPIDTAYWVRPRTAHVDQRFLYLLLLNTNLPGICAQTGVPGLNRERAYEVGLHLPPLVEQRRIISVVDAFECLVVNNAQYISALNALEGPLLNAVLDVGDAEAGPTLADLCTAIVDCEHKTAPEDPQGGAWSVGTPALRLGGIDFGAAKRISIETWIAWTRRMRPQGGDLILAREAPVGPVAIVPEGCRIALGQRTVLLRPDRKQVDSAFLHALLRGPAIQQSLRTGSRGLTVSHLNVADVRSLRLPALPSLSEQRRIADLVGSLDGLRDKSIELSRAASDARELILAELIAGTHRIPDSYDVLLRRV